METAEYQQRFVGNSPCCFTCGERLTAKNNVSCYSAKYDFYKKLSICESCLKKDIAKILESFSDQPQQALISFCQMFDIMVQKDDFNNCMNGIDENFFLDIVKKTAMPKNRGKSFFDGKYLSLYSMSNQKEIKNDLRKKPKKLESEISDIAEEFGAVEGFKSVDYKNMKAYYDNMLISNPKATEVQKQVIRECAKLSAMASKQVDLMASEELDVRRAATTSAKTIEDTISKKMSDAMLRTKDTKDDESAEIRSIGAVFSILERMGKSNDILNYKNELHYNEPRDLPDAVLENIRRVTKGNDKALGIDIAKFIKPEKYKKSSTVYDIPEEEANELGIE